MLTAKTSEVQKGIVILGDYYDLKNLHETILAISQDEMYGIRTINIFSYEIRKAYYGSREKEVYHIDSNDYTYLNVEIPWPIAICTANLLREFAGYINTSKEIQANLYRLEHIIESVIKYEAGQSSYDILKWVNKLKLPQTDYLDHLILYLLYRDEKRILSNDRYVELSNTLNLLNPINKAHQDFQETLRKEAENTQKNVLDLNIDYDRLGLRW